MTEDTAVSDAVVAAALELRDAVHALHRVEPDVLDGIAIGVGASVAAAFGSGRPQLARLQLAFGDYIAAALGEVDDRG